MSGGEHLPALVACLWVVLSAITAFLPMRYQYAPGLSLLLAAPVVLIWLGVSYGLWPVLLGIFAVISMFRHPLRYLVRRVLGKSPPSAEGTR